MPKAKWGGNVTADAIDQAETGYQAYAGELPPRGVYRFRVVKAEQGTSGGGNPKLKVFAILDGTWKKEHAKYDGCPLWDHMPVLDSTLFRVKAFCSGVGVTSKEFLTGMIVDEEGLVTKIGSLAFNNEKRPVMVYINVVQDSSGDTPQLKLNGGGYLPKPEGEEADTSEAADEAKPSKKAGKKKAGKSASVDDDSEPPF